MTVQITTNNRIIIDGQDTGLHIAQRPERTIVFRPENLLTGQTHKEFVMPELRYSLSCQAPASGVPGADVFENDVKWIMDGMLEYESGEHRDMASCAEASAEARKMCTELSIDLNTHASRFIWNFAKGQYEDRALAGKHIGGLFWE